MNPDRRMRLWDLVVEQAGGAAAGVEHVGAVAIKTAGVDAAAAVLTLTTSPRESIYTSSQLATDVEELTTVLGEGPGFDALVGRPALADDLRDSWCQTRWPMFAPGALDCGVRAMFALPLQVGGVHLGVLDLYRAGPGELDHEQLADALLLADTACALLLDSDRPGRPASGGHSYPEEAGPQHPEVHQATGMVAVQLGVTAAVALIRLRAYAYANDRRLRDVAADVVTRRMRFHPDNDGSDAMTPINGARVHDTPEPPLHTIRATV